SWTTRSSRDAPTSRPARPAGTRCGRCARLGEPPRGHAGRDRSRRGPPPNNDRRAAPSLGAARHLSRSSDVGRWFGMTEIVITGSTGVIGRRAVRELLAAGHRVTGVTRSARGREGLENLGARAVEVDVFDEASLRRAFDGTDVVVNLLTHIPGIDRMADPAAWEEN